MFSNIVHFCGRTYKGNPEEEHIPLAADGVWMFVPFGAVAVFPATCYYSPFIKTNENGNPCLCLHVLAKRKDLAVGSGSKETRWEEEIFKETFVAGAKEKVRVLEGFNVKDKKVETEAKSAWVTPGSQRFGSYSLM